MRHPIPDRRVAAARLRLVLQRLALALLAALVLSACGDDASAPSEAPAAKVTDETPGDLRVEVDGDRVTVHAAEAPLPLILERLSAAGGFELMARRAPARRLTVSLDGVPMSSALSTLLDGLAYSVYYAVDDASGAHRLARLRVGSALSAPAPGAAANADQEADERSRRILRDREEIANRMREGLERLRERSRLGDGERREAPVYGAEELASEDPNVRIDAVEMIDVEDEGLEPMLRVLETDPDHRVREAVAERLSMEEGPQVSAALVGALDDPHPKVRLAAIEALEFVDDPSTIPDLERLYDDVDPEVADAAREAVEFLK